MKAARNYRIVGVTRRGTVIVDRGGDLRDTGEHARDWAEPRDLRPGGQFDYFTRVERGILRRGRAIPRGTF